MPQGLGKNLYPDLSVRENIEFFGRLFGQSRDERKWRIAELLDSTGLAPFEDRPAKKLSGGMRQKLGLCCSLIHDPDLLILDEPTTGVDPLSRRQFWELIDRIRSRRSGMSVIVATAYMEEAERFDWLAAMNAGKVLATGSPAEIKRRYRRQPRSRRPSLRCFRNSNAAVTAELKIPPRRIFDADPIITARDLTCRFGDFTAVDRVNFTIERGEIFGFLGSNGCGKTTTMKMLTGLLPPTAGEALLFGKPLDASDMSSRYRVGYMSQSFSLYTELTVRQNLDLHARIFHLPAQKAAARIAELVADIRSCGLSRSAHAGSAIGDSPAALVGCRHRPRARDTHPRRTHLGRRSAGAGSLLGSVDRSFAQPGRDHLRFDPLHERGRTLRPDSADGFGARAGDGNAGGTGQGPGRHHARRRLCQLSRGGDRIAGNRDRSSPTARRSRPSGSKPAHRQRALFSLQRLFAYTIREALELLRDPIRLGFSLLGTTLLMLVFGFGVSTDVNNLSFAVLDRDQTPESRAYLEELRGSSYFVEKAPLTNDAELVNRLKSGDISAAIEIPPSFGSDIKHGRPVSVSALVDGAMPFRAETIRGYLQGMHQLYLSDPAVKTTVPVASPPADIEVRFKYNQDFDSIYAMVPSNMSLLLALFPAILMALAIVREKELGSITNLYVTPVTRLEFLIGKQLPYIAVAMANFTLMFLLALFVFKVPLKGSFPTLLLGVLIYVTTTTGYGMLISAFTRTQIAALFGTAILTVLPATQFAGMMTPVSSLAAGAQIIGRGFPMTYFVPISVGTFTKGLGFADLSGDLLALVIFVPVFTLVSILLLRKQER